MYKYFSSKYSQRKEAQSPLYALYAIATSIFETYTKIKRKIQISSRNGIDVFLGGRFEIVTDVSNGLITTRLIIDPVNNQDNYKR